jgi:UDP-2,3-diacylglucosamine pyrophosphatase LpxH
MDPHPNVYIVSDLHLGNEHFCHDHFISWLNSLPEGAQLILNGDVLDDPELPLNSAHAQVLDRLREESHARSVIWIRGNHDRDVELADSAKIRFEPRWEIGRRLLVVHGDRFDGIMPRYPIFKHTFKLLHRILIVVGFPDVHVAQFAKKWNFLYRVLNRHVAGKALQIAQSQDFEVVTCGHTHAATAVESDGRHYLNTGAWTEPPHCYVEVSDEVIDLKIYPNGQTLG